MSCRAKAVCENHVVNTFFTKRGRVLERGREEERIGGGHSGKPGTASKEEATKTVYTQKPAVLDIRGLCQCELL